MVQSLTVDENKKIFLLRAWDLDVMVTFAERGMGRGTLQTWHNNKFPGIGALQPCKGKKEFKVTTAGVDVLTWEELKTSLRKIACLEAGLMYWYVGVVVTFTTLTGGTETVLTEKLNKTTLINLQRTLTAHSQKWVTEVLQIVWFTETWTHSFPAPREVL